MSKEVKQQTKPEIQIMTYFYWSDFQDLICDKLGIDHKDFRDYVHESDKEKHDLWHFFMERLWYGDIQNDSYRELWYLEVEENDVGTWKEKVVEAYNQAFKDLEDTGVPEVFVYVYW